MSGGIKHSLWIMPTGVLYEELSTLISVLSREFGTPVFPPHVTLLGEITGSIQDLSTRASSLAQQLPPYKLELGAVDHLDDYFRCLFTRIKETPEVMAAHRQAREVFNMASRRAYMPHLSLLYGDIATEVKKGIIDRIGSEMTGEFRVTELVLVSTEGEPKDWRLVGQFRLSGQDIA